MTPKWMYWLTACLALGPAQIRIGLADYERCYGIYASLWLPGKEHRTAWTWHWSWTWIDLTKRKAHG